MCSERALRYGRQRGLTLIELIVFIVIVSIGLAGILGVMNLTTRNSANPMAQKQAVAMAEALLDEILAKSASDTLPETDLAGCSHRAQYVGVNDYACFTGASATTVITGVATLGATPMAALAGFAATVVVTPMNVSGVDMLRVAVQVQGAGQNITLFGYKWVETP